MGKSQKKNAAQKMNFRIKLGSKELDPRTHLYIFFGLYVCVSLYVCMCVCVCVRVCACMYMYVCLGITAIYLIKKAQI